MCVLELPCIQKHFASVFSLVFLLLLPLCLLAWMNCTLGSQGGRRHQSHPGRNKEHTTGGQDLYIVLAYYCWLVSMSTFSSLTGYYSLSFTPFEWVNPSYYLTIWLFEYNANLFLSTHLAMCPCVVNELKVPHDLPIQCMSPCVYVSISSVWI